MRVLLFDMRDSPVPGDRQIILRLVDDTGILRAQSPIYGEEDFARNLGEVLAGAFGTELVWLGPSSSSEFPEEDEAGRVLRQGMLEQLVPDEQFADGLRQRALF